MLAVAALPTAAPSVLAAPARYDVLPQVSTSTATPLLPPREPSQTPPGQVTAAPGGGLPAPGAGTPGAGTAAPTSGPGAGTPAGGDDATATVAADGTGGDGGASSPGSAPGAGDGSAPSSVSPGAATGLAPPSLPGGAAEGAVVRRVGLLRVPVVVDDPAAAALWRARAGDAEDGATGPGVGGPDEPSAAERGEEEPAAGDPRPGWMRAAESTAPGPPWLVVGLLAALLLALALPLVPVLRRAGERGGAAADAGDGAA